MQDKEIVFYYPQNLSAQLLIANMWSLKDMSIMAGILVFSILIFLFTKTIITFSLIIIYGFFTLRINGNYSIAKLMILYIRYLFTDVLFFKWRE